MIPWFFRHSNVVSCCFWKYFGVPWYFWYFSLKAIYQSTMILISSLHHCTTTVHFVRVFRSIFTHFFQCSWTKLICFKSDLKRFVILSLSICVFFLLAWCAFVNFACRWQHSVLTTELISTTGHQYFCMAHIKGHINTVLALFCWESTVSSDITPDRWDWFWSPSALHWLAALCRDIQSMCVFVTWTLVASHRSDASYCISITEYVWVESRKVGHVLLKWGVL